MKIISFISLFFIFSLSLNYHSFSQSNIETDIPHLQMKGNTVQLIVEGKPFIALSGELRNNNATNLDFLEPIWQKLVDGNLNSVIAGVSWAMVEQEEGAYNFDILNGVIHKARENNLKLILIWFASWKNGKSSYVPDWVKRDYNRFPRIKLNNTEPVEILSALGTESRDADAKAFAALMKHIKLIDGRHHTVIMMQVENEVGVLADSRDRSEIANKAYKEKVPDELMKYLIKNKEKLAPELLEAWESNGMKKSGNWEEIFGPGKPEGFEVPLRTLVPPMSQEEQDKALVTYPFLSDEAFMAWHYAKYLNHVIEAGKAEYPIPMFVNAWLKQQVHAWPGSYPSGGPLPHVFDIWRAGAPAVDIMSPDLYRPDFAHMCKLYTRSGNPLFIPETNGGDRGAVNVIYAIGEHDALGFSPFAIEYKIDPEGDLAHSYKMLSELIPLIGKRQGTYSIGAVLLSKENPSGEVAIGNYLVQSYLQNSSVFSPGKGKAHGAAIFIMVSPEEFYVAGTGLTVSFSVKEKGLKTGLATVEEGNFKNGHWIPGRRLAGDETDQGDNIRLGTGFSIQRVTLYNYK